MSSQGSNSVNQVMDFMDFQDKLFNSLDYPEKDWPALNEGEFKTDEFRMYRFKVYPCRRTYKHVWTQCPFYHSGENARRRDPRLFNYSPLQCQAFRANGTCTKGDQCEFAHGLFETWLHPGQYRTRVCRDRGRCTRPMCFFAHDEFELRLLYKKTGSAERAFPTHNLPVASPARPPLSSLSVPPTSEDHIQQLLQNMRLGIDDNIWRETSTFPVVRRPRTYVSSDTSFSGGPGPFYKHNSSRMHQ